MGEANGSRDVVGGALVGWRGPLDGHVNDWSSSPGAFWSPSRQMQMLLDRYSAIVRMYDSQTRCLGLGNCVDVPRRSRGGVACGDAISRSKLAKTGEKEG